jgi:hypothetical protein
MTIEEFIDVLEQMDYYYTYGNEGDKIVVNTGKIDDNNDKVWLSSISSIPPNVEFNNKGDVDLRSIKVMPSGVVFNNGGDAILYHVGELLPGVIFNNGGNVTLGMPKIHPGVTFNNSGDVNDSSDWKGNIEGIDSKMLLNLMIKQGVFI